MLKQTPNHHDTNSHRNYNESLRLCYESFLEITSNINRKPPSIRWFLYCVYEINYLVLGVLNLSNAARSNISLSSG